MFGSLRKSVVVVAVAAASVVSAGFAQTTAWAARGAAPSAPTVTSPAPGAPGALSHFDLARKDCLGTARNTTSKIWYTVANGVLSDVYAPTVDTTNVETMQYIVTDGSTFTDLQSRDTTYTASADATGMVCTITTTSAGHGYQLRTTYSTDTARSSVIVHTQYVPLTDAAKSYQLYVRLDATAGGNGGGGTGNGGADSATVDTSTGQPVPVSFDTNTTTNAVNRDYGVPTYLALQADRAFTSVSSGFVGTASDALAQLDATHAMSPTYTDATSGNVEQTARIALNRGATTLALGFGTTQAAAVHAAKVSSSLNYQLAVEAYQLQWQNYDRGLRKPATHLTGLSKAQVQQAAAAYYVSANVVKASEDKTFAGAIAASLTSPWGQAVSAGDPANTYFGSYREIFARDLYEAWTALLTDGDLSTARDAVRFLFLHQQLPDGSMPRNSLVNGKVAPDSFNTQLDEVAYPILMAQQSGIGNDPTLWSHIKAAADYLVSHGPAAGPERWEEQSGYSPSTIAAEIAGLVAAGELAKQHSDADSAQVYLATADLYQRSIKNWAVTTNGPLSTAPYFIRLSKTGDPNAAFSYGLGNGGPFLDQRSVIDAGFLELVRLGELAPSDATVANSLSVVDATISRTTTANGTGWLRYNGDGYGDCYAPDPLTDCGTTGTPWAPSGHGTGHIWPVLSAERGEQNLATGDPSSAAALLVSMGKLAGGVGLVPEQDWDFPDVAASPFGTDPTVASIGFTNGQPDGSATPLTWGAASEVRLAADLAAGSVVEKPTSTTDRYVTHTQLGTTLTVTAPADNSPGTGTVDVVGTAAPGATIVIADVATDANDVTTFFHTTAQPDGSFTVPVPVAVGTNVLVITAQTATGATAQTVRTLVNDVVSGTLLLSVTDPNNDDNGPGNYAYPTASDFHAGAFDLQQFQVYDTGTTVTFRVQTRDLTPTFGPVNGAQLVDVYVHNPAATTTSTLAADPARNYSIAAAGAWSRLIEVQGFGQRFVDASLTNTVGQVNIRANSVSRYITFTVDKSALGGTPASGWSFTVTLHGQDGFSPGQARTFASTPQPYQFGECVAATSDPHCTFSTSSLPQVMDAITPAGVSQATELDYTLGAVVLNAVPIS